MQIEAIHYRTGQPIAIHLQNGVIGAMDPLPSRPKPDVLVAPGLVDLQINGYGGLDMNRVPIAQGTLGQMTRRLWGQGVTSYFPTVITNSAEAIEQAMTAIARECEEDHAARNGVAGIHLEGPFISPEDGARGAHERAFVRPPDWDLFRRWQEAAGGRIRILTLSPEWPTSAAFVERCTAAGVTVSIGHTSAKPQQIADAVKAGARMSTHLGNGAHLMLPRHPNYIWEQLAQDDLWACLIADGFHVPDQLLKVVMKVKGPRAMLVSDAVSLCGMPPGEYTMPVGGRVVLTAEGRLHLAENPKLLAGSAQMLARGVENLVCRGLAGLAEAWEMASLRPAGFMGLPAAAGLAVGGAADLVVLRWQQGNLHAQQTYKSGQRVWVES
jgi:N-acetylglucosamine-6-phosphate deacetylase